jgi:hypothetical protein
MWRNNRHVIYDYRIIILDINFIGTLEISCDVTIDNLVNYL